MRTNKNKRRQNTVAYLLFAVIVVQIAIYLVWKNSTSKSEELVAETVSVDAAQLDNSFHPDLYDPNATPQTPPQTRQARAADSQPRALSNTHRSRRSHHSSDRTPKTPTQTVEEPIGVGSLSIITTPEGASVYIDGIFAGKSPLWNIEAAEGQHKIMFEHKDARPKTLSVSIRADGDRKVSETLQLRAVPAVVATNTTPLRLPRTPTVGSKTVGNSKRGKSILSAKCNACHRKTGGTLVGAGMRTASQWQRFFSRGSHDRYQRIGQDMNSGQIAHVKSYLMSKAADTDKNQGAGVRQ